MNNKVRNTLYFMKGFLINPYIPIPYKQMLFSAIVIGKVSNYTPQTKKKKKKQEVNRHYLTQDYTSLRDFLMGIVVHPFIVFLKNLTFLLFL
jgi:hypothetical protein